MIKFLVSIIALLVTFSIYGQKQFQYSIKAGPHLTMVKGLETSNYNKEIGYHAGFGIEYVISNPLGFKIEMLYSTRGFKNYSEKNLTYKNIKYSNIVSQSSIFIPIVFNYHLKKLSFELGPHFDILINSNQIESFREIWKDGTNKILDYKYNNRHHFNKLSLGANIGLNLDIFKRLNMSARYIQYFTNLGYEYSWKKYGMLDISIGYYFGNKIEVKKAIVNKTNFEGQLKNYTILDFKGFIKVDFLNVAVGNKIVFQLNKINSKYDIISFISQESSGFIDQSSNLVVVNDVLFPFKGKIELILIHKLNKVRVKCILEFEIYESGVWNISPNL